MRACATLKAIAAVIAVSTTALYVLCNTSDHFNGFDPASDVTVAQKLGNRAYFTMQAFSTVGFGDVSPRSLTCRVLTSCVFLAILVQVVDVLASRP